MTLLPRPQTGPSAGHPPRPRPWPRPLCRQCCGLALEPLRPDLTYRLTGSLHAPLRPVPAPHTAAIRGAARILQSAQAHPSAGLTTHPPGPDSG